MQTSKLRIAAGAALALVATALPVLGATAGAAEQAPRGDASRAPALLSAAPDRTGRPATRPVGTTRSRLVSVDRDLLPARAAGQRITFNLFDDADFTGVVRSRQKASGSTSWSGDLTVEGGYFYAVRVDSTYLLHVASPEGVYEISQVGGETYQVSEVDQRDESEAGSDAVVPPVRAEPAAPADRPDSAGEPPVGDPGDVIDVAVLYTPQALAGAGGQAQMDALVALAVAETNGGYGRSGVAPRIRLVGSGATATTEVGGSLFTDLDRLTAIGDGFYDEAHGLRDAVHADQVSLIVEDSTGNCGLGWLQAEQDYSFSVVARGCATGNYTFGHELGHNQGADHDTYPGVPVGSTIPYARGYVNVQAGWRTVMGYNDACVAAGSNCVRLQNFSNAAVLEAGLPTGTAATANFQVLNESALRMAGHRQSRIYPDAPAIAGSPRVGRTLTAVPGTWQPAGLAFAYQWFADGVPVAGATGTTFTPKRSHRRQVVTVLVTGAGGTYAPAQAASVGTAPIAKGKFVAKRPKLKGVPRVGGKLTAKLKGWKPKVKAKKVKYTWYRNGNKIKGVTGRTIRLTPRLRGTKVSVKVVVRKKGYLTAKKKSRKVRVRPR